MLFMLLCGYDCQVSQLKVAQVSEYPLKSLQVNGLNARDVEVSHLLEEFAFD